MVKTINQSFEDAVFDKLQEIKNKSGLAWDVFIIKAAEAYENKMKAKELIEGEE